MAKDGVVDAILGQSALEPFLKQRTHNALVKDLAKNIPCRYLDDQKKEIKARPNQEFCQCCQKEDSCVRLFKCGACKVVEYCSKKECQMEDRKVSLQHCSEVSCHEERMKLPPGKELSTWKEYLVSSRLAKH
jgi:hypothetical protein